MQWWTKAITIIPQVVSKITLVASKILKGSDKWIKHALWENLLLKFTLSSPINVTRGENGPQLYFDRQQTNVSVMQQKRLTWASHRVSYHAKHDTNVPFSADDAVFLPHGVHLAGFIRVFTTSLTSQRGEKLHWPQTDWDLQPSAENKSKRNILLFSPWPLFLLE